MRRFRFAGGKQRHQRSRVMSTHSGSCGAATRHRQICPQYVKPVVYDDLLDRLLSTYCTEGLTGLSVRWIQPYQQQGRRMPSFSSVRTLSTCSLLVSGFFTEIAQQIHSLRASGVRSSHTASAVASEVRVSRKSSGNSWTTPPEITFSVIVIHLYSHQTALARKGCRSAWRLQMACLLPRRNCSTQVRAAG